MPQVAQRGRPLAVRRLVLRHQEERLVLVAGLEPVDREVGDHVGDVTLVLHALAHLDHRRVVVAPLAGQDVPVIEAGGIGHQVPLAEDRGLVAGGLEQFGKRDLRAVEAAVGVVEEAVGVAVLAGEDGGPRRPADGVGHEAPVEAHALLRDAIDVGRLDQLPRIAIGADGLVGVVVGEDEDDVGPLGGEGRGRREQKGREGEEAGHGEVLG